MSRRLPRRIGLALVALVAALAAAEVGFRAYLRLRGTPYDGRAVEDELRRMLAPVEGFVPHGPVPSEDDRSASRWLHPYYASEKEPDTGGVLRHFATGVAEDELSVLVLGGSVAAFWAEEQREVVERRLAEVLPGRDVVLLNFAHAAYKAPQPLTRVAYLFCLGHRPDAVVLLDGFNEVCNGVRNGLTGTHPLYPSFPLWGGLVESYAARGPEEVALVAELWQLRERTLALLRASLARHEAASAITGTLAVSRVRALGARGAELQARLAGLSTDARSPAEERMVFGPEYADDIDSLLAMSVESWFEQALAIRALCAEHDVLFLHVLQPALFDPAGKPRTGRELAIAPGSQGWRIGQERGYPLLRERGRELARRGVRFVDATDVFSDVEEELYTDPCHFGARGNELLTERILSALLPELGR